MLQLVIQLTPEGWDEEKEEFVQAKEQILQLEHSLISLSKWESKWCKPFLSKVEKTDEEVLDYIKCMTLTQNIKPDVYEKLNKTHMDQINKYIEAPMTATFINEDSNGKINREPVTSELIYYWMISLQIPFECQKWHLNRLLSLIKVINFKNTPPKKHSRREIMSRNAALNASRRQRLNTRG